jgi:hypothetical protein
VDDNYIFSNQDRPGIIYIPPVRTPLPDPPPSRPNPPDSRPRRPAREHRDSQCTTAICRSCPRIEEYIGAVERAERAFPSLTSMQMVTSLRKLWDHGTYNAFVWDRMLEDANTEPFALDGFSRTDRWFLNEIDCLRTPQHICTDFGHVLTGVDATNYPDANDYAVRQLDTPQKVIAGCTWSGDLGSVYRSFLRWAATHPWVRDVQRLVERFNTEWRNLASVEDLLGDVDGVVLGSRFSSSRPFSAQLRAYYARSNTQANIFQAFPRIHSTSSQNIKDMTWAWIEARDPWIVQTRVEVLLDAVASRFQQFVRDGQAGRAQNRCETVRSRVRQRPTTTAPAAAASPSSAPRDAGPPAGVP